MLLSTARAVEVRPETVRIPRGILGLGFHTGVAARDVEAVLENPFLTPEANPKHHGVALQLKNGAPYSTATRMRDPAGTRDLASLLSSVLPKRWAREFRRPRPAGTAFQPVRLVSASERGLPYIRPRRAGETPRA